MPSVMPDYFLISDTGPNILAFVPSLLSIMDFFVTKFVRSIENLHQCIVNDLPIFIDDLLTNTSNILQYVHTNVFDTIKATIAQL